MTIAAEVTAISTIVGTAAAFPLVRSRLPFRTGIRIGMTLPIMIPGLLIGVSLLVLLTTVFKWQLSPQTAVIGQAVYTTPFVLLLVAARLQGFDPALERAASDLGANTARRLRYVVLPLIMLLQFVFTLSLAYLFATANVYFRDVQHLVGVPAAMAGTGEPVLPGRADPPGAAPGAPKP